MGSGTQVVTGDFVATGASLDVETVGFRPRIVRLKKKSGTVGTMEWDDTMADAAGFKQVGGTTSVISTGGITPIAKGFTLGTDAMNVDGTLWTYECWR